jgi:hypothetical protein
MDMQPKVKKKKMFGKQLDVLDNGPNTGKIHEDIFYKKV